MGNPGNHGTEKTQKKKQPQSTNGPRYLIPTPKVPVHSGAWQLVGTPNGVGISALVFVLFPGCLAHGGVVAGFKPYRGHRFWAMVLSSGPRDAKHTSVECVYRSQMWEFEVVLEICERQQSDPTNISRKASNLHNRLLQTHLSE